jgi:hypothetical protein
MDALREGLAKAGEWDVFCLANPRDRDGAEAGKAKLKATLEAGLGAAATELFPSLGAGKLEEFLGESLAGDTIDAPAISKWLEVRSAPCRMLGLGSRHRPSSFLADARRMPPPSPVQENVSDDTRKQPSFIRILSGSVLRRGVQLLIASADGKLDAAGDGELKVALELVCQVLLPFVEDNTELQTEILFEAQKLCEESGHKSGATTLEPPRSRPCTGCEAGAVQCGGPSEPGRPRPRPAPSHRHDAKDHGGSLQRGRVRV